MQYKSSLFIALKHRAAITTPYFKKEINGTIKKKENLNA